MLIAQKKKALVCANSQMLFICNYGRQKTKILLHYLSALYDAQEFWAFVYHFVYQILLTFYILRCNGLQAFIKNIAFKPLQSLVLSYVLYYYHMLLWIKHNIDF